MMVCLEIKIRRLRRFTQITRIVKETEGRRVRRSEVRDQRSEVGGLPLEGMSPLRKWTIKLGWINIRV